MGTIRIDVADIIHQISDDELINEIVFRTECSRKKIGI